MINQDSLGSFYMMQEHVMNWRSFLNKLGLILKSWPFLRCNLFGRRGGAGGAFKSVKIS
jgi:hypothetical protein